MDKIDQVDLDEKLEQDNQQEDPAKEEGQEKEAPEAEETTEAKALLDLTKAEKFLFKGQEWTPQDLEKAMLRQQDYTKKTQAIAEERKYFDNLSADLQRVKANPDLVEEFKKVYPEKFHGYVDVLGIQAAKKEEPQSKGAELPREFLERIERIEGAFTEKEKETFNAKLDSIEQSMKGKYRYANATDVYGAADEFFKENGVKPRDVDEKMMEPFFKASHEYNLSLFKEWQKEQLKTAKETNDRAGDIGRGGGTPGQAPKKYRNLDEVADDIIASEGY